MFMCKREAGENAGLVIERNSTCLFWIWKPLGLGEKVKPRFPVLFLKVHLNIWGVTHPCGLCLLPLMEKCGIPLSIALFIQFFAHVTSCHCPLCLFSATSLPTWLYISQRLPDLIYLRYYPPMRSFCLRWAYTMFILLVFSCTFDNILFSNWNE